MPVIYECDRCGEKSSKPMNNYAIVKCSIGIEFVDSSGTRMLCEKCLMYVLHAMSERFPRSGS